MSALQEWKATPSSFCPRSRSVRDLGDSHRFVALEQGLAQFRSDIDKRFNWLIGIVVGSWITMIAAILFHR
jgi:hypothetical protein